MQGVKRGLQTFWRASFGMDMMVIYLFGSFSLLVWKLWLVWREGSEGSTLRKSSDLTSEVAIPQWSFNPGSARQFWRTLHCNLLPYVTGQISMAGKKSNLQVAAIILTDQHVCASPSFIPPPFEYPEPKCPHGSPQYRTPKPA
jgi:hypothetical protein